MGEEVVVAAAAAAAAVAAVAAALAVAVTVASVFVGPCLVPCCWFSNFYIGCKNERPKKERKEKTNE